MEQLIQNCSIIDGSGISAYIGSIGIQQGKLLLFPGNTAPSASKIFDGTGLTAVPGFIDAHSHGDLTMRGQYATMSKISQGITSQVAGQCGISMFPVDVNDAANFPSFVSGIVSHPEFPDDLSSCGSAGSFFGWLDTLHNPIQTYSFVGHGTLRLWAMGYENRRPDATEQKRMQDMLRRCIREGALGLSTGLIYAPGCYADNEEILSLLRVVHEEGGAYACHPRNESDRVIQARQECIRLAKEADVPLCLSHLKTAGRDNWGKSEQLLRDAESAVAQGQQILIDCYPYCAGNTALNVSIPPRYFVDGLDGLVKSLQSKSVRNTIRAEISRKSDYDNYVYNCGGFSGVFVSSCPVDHDSEGQFITDYAKRIGVDPFDAYCDILIKNGGLGLGIYFHMSEDDVLRILSHPLCVVGTDGLLGLETEHPHPRTFGTMARAYRLLVQDSKQLTAEQAIRKMSGQTADFLRLSGKGYLRSGYDADLVLLDLPNFADHATFGIGNERCSGIQRVYSGGACVYQSANADILGKEINL
ncbi:MAG: amidohydrolase family protein [Clostridia bacterium]